jgi:hypothetical protein
MQLSNGVENNAEEAREARSLYIPLKRLFYLGLVMKSNQMKPTQ